MNIFKKLFGENSHLQEGVNEIYHSNGKLKERGKSGGIFKAFLHGSWSFFKHYIFKLGFLGIASLY